jgi:hypothetical protein
MACGKQDGHTTPSNTLKAKTNLLNRCHVRRQTVQPPVCFFLFTLLFLFNALQAQGLPPRKHVNTTSKHRSTSTDLVQWEKRRILPQDFIPHVTF